MSTVTVSPISPGHVQVYSNLEQAVAVGEYEIDITQNFGPDATQKLHTTKAFSVASPPFTIGPSDIHSQYPVPSSSEHANVLPHITLKDPSLPWARRTTEHDLSQLRKVPWLALISFDETELVPLDQAVLKLNRDQVMPTAAARAGSSQSPPFTPSSTGAITLTVAELMALKTNARAQVALTAGIASSAHLENDSTLQTIFISRELAVTLFGQENDAATSFVPPADGRASSERYAYLAHVRHINASGLNQAEEQAVVSTIICHRTGPSSSTTPKKMAVHLVSLDGLGEISLKDGPSTACLISLYSWTYMCIPATHAAFQDGMRKLVKDFAPLRYSSSQIEKAVQKASPAEKTWIQDRLSRGYTIARSVVQTGEPTTALIRGLFSPVKVARAGRGPSNDGYSLEMLDTDTGMMDLTYSAAWNLGRTVALANRSFSESMLRLRSELHRRAMVDAKKIVDDSFLSRQDLAHKLAQAAQGVTASIETAFKDSGFDLDSRWHSFAQVSIPGVIPGRQRASWFDEQLRSNFSQQLWSLAALVGQTWQADLDVVTQWVKRSMMLDGIPPYYLVPDLRTLPHETIRTFYIDDSWLDAYLDGALSVGNHYDDEDQARSVIKHAIDEALAADKTRCPRWGFLVRSEQMSGNQELILSVEPGDQGPSFLSSKKLANDVCLFSFSRWPEDSHFGGGSTKGIKLCQPPHQPCYSIPLTSDHVELEVFGSMPSGNGSQYAHWTATWQKDDQGRKGKCDDLKDLPPIYNWSTRTLNPINLAAACAEVLRGKMPTSHLLLAESGTKALGSAAVALQLNDNVFEIHLATDHCAKMSKEPLNTPIRKLCPQGIPNTTPIPKDPPVKKPSLPVRVRAPAAPPASPKPGPGPLGQATETIIQIDQIKIAMSIWPLLTYRKAVPANLGHALDLVVCIKSPDALMIPSLTTMVLTIPCGPSATDLFVLGPITPRVRLLGPTRRWKSTTIVPDLDKRDELRIILSPRSDKAPNINPLTATDDMSFLLTNVSGSAAPGVCQVTVETRTSFTKSFMGAVYGPVLNMADTRTVAVAKEALPAGSQWP